MGARLWRYGSALHMKRKQKKSASALLALVGLIFGGLYAYTAGNIEGSGTASLGSKNMKSWFVTYKRAMAPPGMISQIVTRTHGCLLTVTGPMVGVDLPDRAEIGRYRRTCDVQEADSLRSLAVAAISEALASKAQAGPRGTRFLAFGIGEIGNEAESLASVPLSGPFPPAVKRFDDAMIAAAKKSLDRPHVTLKGTASFPFSTVMQQVELELALRNSGTVPILIRNPAAAEDDEKVGLEVLLEKNLPPERLEDEDRALVRLKKGEVTQLRAPGEESGGKAQPIVRLDPGQEVVLSAKIKRYVYLGAGVYRAWVTYESRTDGIPEADGVPGRLRIPAGTFTVKGR